MASSNQSSSDFIISDILEFDKSFTDFEEIPTMGFNRLFKAKRYGKWFLLKGLKAEYASQTLYKELLRKEFEISINMDHPNIVRTINIDQLPNIGYCIIYEYIEGCTLHTYLNEAHTLDEKKKITDELIESISYIHKKQIVHRDLKPENIMITTNGHNLKLIDFGLADTDSYSVLKQPAGTEKYISPEQRTMTTADCRNDIYSLGKIILEINPGFIYRHAAYRCLVPIAQRYKNAEELQLRIGFEKRLARIIAYSFSCISFFLVTVALTFSISQSTKDSQSESINQTILYGKDKINEFNIPLRNFIDTVSTFNQNAYLFNQQLIEERETKVAILLDSLTKQLKEPDQTNIRNALNSYMEQTIPHF